MKKAVENIQRLVMQEAEEEARRILTQAGDERAQMLEQAGEEEEQKARAHVREEQARLEQHNLREIAQAYRAMRREHLAARNRVIEDIFSRVREEVLRLPSARYRELLQNWISDIDAQDGGEYLPGSQDARLLADLVAELNSKRSPESRFTLSQEKAPFESGFIFRTPRYEIERSLTGWLEEMKKEMTPQLERELFGALWGHA